jgi:hypothetical protein
MAMAESLALDLQACIDSTRGLFRLIETQMAGKMSSTKIVE